MDCSRVRADDFSRIANLDAPEPRRARKKRVGGDADAGHQRAAQIFAALGDHVEIDGRAEIHHDARPAVLCEGGHAIDDAVGAHFLRIVVVDGHAGADAGLDEKRLGMKISLGHLLERGIQRRHNRTDDHAVNFVGIEARQREQIAREDAVFVHGLVARGSQAPVGDQFLIAKDAQHRVGIADVQSQQHQFASATSPEMTTAIRPSSRRTRSSPFGSRPSVMPM